MTLRDPKQAAIYLYEHDYLNIKYSHEPAKVSYKDNTGDMTWEHVIAPDNNWAREEKGKCCRETERSEKSRETTKPSRCCKCGISINGFVGWILADWQGIEDLVLKAELQVA